MTTVFDLTFPSGFHYEHTVYSHGWCALLPFTLERSTQLLRYPIALTERRSAELRFSLPSQRAPRVEVVSSGALSAAHREFLAHTASQILHLDLDLRHFHRRIRSDNSFGWMARQRAGRMLRAPTFFEDAAKMLLTTNCSWNLTELMVERICTAFGHPAPGGAYCFPTPEAIADSSETFLREVAKLGYRAPFLLEMARRIVHGDLAIEQFRRSSLPVEELYRELRGIKGIGEYAASNLLKLLGRFDKLGLDSWCRAKFAELHGGGNRVSDAEIEAFYAPYQEWKGLVMWLDVTRHWYAQKFPF